MKDYKHIETREWWRMTVHGYGVKRVTLF